MLRIGSKPVSKAFQVASIPLVANCMARGGQDEWDNEPHVEPYM